MRVKPWKYFLCCLIGIALSSTWISFALRNLDPRTWWVFPLTMSVGLVLFGGGILIGGLSAFPEEKS